MRAACNLYPCPRSFISPFFDHNFLFSLFPSSFFFFLVRLISFLSSLFHERTRKTLGTRIHVTTAEQFELWIHITIQPTTQHLRFKVQYCHADSQSMGAIKVITICRNFQIVTLYLRKKKYAFCKLRRPTGKLTKIMILFFLYTYKYLA